VGAHFKIYGNYFARFRVLGTDPLCSEDQVTCNDIVIGKEGARCGFMRRKQLSMAKQQLLSGNGSSQWHSKAGEIS
jgi:hypothetical protein